MVKSNRFYKQKLSEIDTKAPTELTNDKSTQLNTCKPIQSDETKCLDTVGAICLDSNGNFASAVSSGGILLKHPGRVGQASMFGCGCWVDEQEMDSIKNEAHSIALCTTGCGEYIIKTLFAKECADHILRNTSETQYSLDEFFKKKFFSKTF